MKKFLSLVAISVIGIIFGYHISKYFFEGHDILSGNEEIKEEKVSPIKERNSHYSYFNKGELYADIGYGKEIAELSGQKIYGGIVPHHLFALKDISNFFLNLKDRNINTIVIVGPNHEEKGRGDILVSQYDYKTPWGLVNPDMSKVDILIKSGFVYENEEIFKTEHSISSLVSYIKFYLPETNIVPIIVKSKAKDKDLDKLSGLLDRILGENDVVLASVDFSHYLNRFGAQFHDDKSISAIANFNFDTLKKIEVDSPNSLRVLLKYLERRGAMKMSHYKNTNSALYSSFLDYENVTSYLFSFFTKGSSLSDESISFISFGDAMFDRGIRKVMENDKDMFSLLRGEEGKFLKGYDFGILNLEGPITTSEFGQDKIYNFKFDPSVAEILSQNNFSLVNLANNHIYDHYSKGVEDTFYHLKKAGVEHFGGIKIEDSNIIKSVGDKKVAFVGIDETTRPIKLDNFYPLLQKLKVENDFVVVNIHWGYEYNELPSDIQINIGHKLIDNGADVVLGHHPHVIQPVEIYKNGVIFYSLGNFIFDQFSPETKVGLGVGSVLERDKKTFYLFPFDIVGGRPKLFDYKKSEEFCRDLLDEIDNKDVCSFYM